VPDSKREAGASLATWLVVLVLLQVFVGHATAQSSDPGSAFCSSTMASTIQNLFSIIQFGGPLVGGVLALGATVSIPLVRRSDYKKEMKTIRNQGLLYGVLIAPLGTEIVQFMLNNIVAGGTSCGF
jgi:hypothetical protein